LTARSTYKTEKGPYQIIDTLPHGMRVDLNSAKLNGTAVTVTQTGNRITLDDIMIPAEGEATLVLIAYLDMALPVGRYENRAIVIDAETGEAVTAEASAAVEIMPEAVFDCGDVYGKVFIDSDGNGVQGGSSETGVTARLMTVTGDIITTDAQGRFNVPCAALPDQSGTNFSLKLDTRSLPKGYVVTTENPRVVRLTKGKMSQINFGVAQPKLVKIALSNAAFTADGQIGSALGAGLTQLAKTTVDQPVHLAINFVLGDGLTKQSADALLRKVVTYVKDRRRGFGGGSLTHSVAFQKSSNKGASK